MSTAAAETDHDSDLRLQTLRVKYDTETLVAAASVLDKVAAEFFACRHDETPGLRVFGRIMDLGNEQSAAGDPCGSDRHAPGQHDLRTDGRTNARRGSKTSLDVRNRIVRFPEVAGGRNIELILGRG